LTYRNGVCRKAVVREGDLVFDRSFVRCPMKRGALRVGVDRVTGTARRARAWPFILVLVIFLGGVSPTTLAAAEELRNVKFAPFKSNVKGGMPRSFKAGCLFIICSSESVDSGQEFRKDPKQVLLQAAPAAPNESRVTGEILEVERLHSSVLHIEPPQVLTRMRLRLLSVQSVGGMPNPLYGREGETLQVLSRERVESNLVGKVISGTIVYRGDERGGAYWLFDVQSTARD
jgi:hypothetical protein